MEGKACTDRILDGEMVTFGGLPRDAAERFLEELQGIGVIGRLEEYDRALIDGL